MFSIDGKLNWVRRRRLISDLQLFTEAHNVHNKKAEYIEHHLVAVCN